MADEEYTEVLCIPGERRNYAVEFPYVEEICKDIMISLMPCLPEHFAGVCNYKGSIVPVVCPDDSVLGGEQAGTRQMVLVLRHHKYYLGILLYQEPCLTRIGVDEQIRGPEQQVTGLWTEKAYFMWNDSLYSLIDVEKTLETLVIFE